MSRMQVHNINESDWLRIAKRADMGRANDTVIYVFMGIEHSCDINPVWPSRITSGDAGSEPG